MRRVEARGPAPVEVVWDRYTRPALWRTWSPQIRGVQHEGERVRTGGAGVVQGPLGVRVRFTIDDVDDDARTWAWTVRVGPLLVPMRHGVDRAAGGAEQHRGEERRGEEHGGEERRGEEHGGEADGRRTRAWVEIGGPRPMALAYTPVARLALRRLVRSG